MGHQHQRRTPEKPIFSLFPASDNTGQWKSGGQRIVGRDGQLHPVNGQLPQFPDFGLIIGEDPIDLLGIAPRRCIAAGVQNVLDRLDFIT
jgi:hypothetical protein